MGGIWLDGRSSQYPSLVDVVAGAGLVVRTWEGWQTRARSSGGIDNLQLIVAHHTASPSTSSFDNDWRYCAVGNPDAPVAQMLLGRDGTVGIHAAGASNHAGRGGPWTGSRGTVPLDTGNSRSIGIEAQNNGTGEPWAPVMVDAYERLVAALCRAYSLDPGRDVAAHTLAGPGWTNRKIDPWGGAAPTPGFAYTGPRIWAMPGFTANVAARMTDPDPEEDDMVPVLQLIAPSVPGIAAPAWFVRYSSGHLVWASNAESLWCAANGIAPTVVEMGADQYSRLVAEATGWPPEPAAPAPASSDPEPAGTL